MMAKKIDKPERQKKVRILGKRIEFDEHIEWRVKVGQYGAVISSLLGIISYIVVQFHSAFMPLTIVFGIVALIFGAMLYYGNISIPILRKLSKEFNVLIILLLSFCNFCIDIFSPVDEYSWIYGTLFLMVVLVFLCLDAVRLKSRWFVIFWGIIFAFINLNNIFHRLLWDSTKGMILFQYTVNGRQFDFRRRDIQRSIFFQILCFAMNGLWTMINDSKMEKMMFATGHIYRETGTASKYVEDRKYSQKIQEEANTKKSLQMIT